MPVFTIETPSGHQLDIEAADEAAAVAGAQDWYKQNVTYKTDTSLTGALAQGASDVAKGFGKTVKEYVSPEVGKTIEDKGASVANPKYQSATDRFLHPEKGDTTVMGLGVGSIPRALVENAPGLATDLALYAATKKLGPVGQAIAQGVGYWGRNAGNEAQKRATARTGDDNATPDATDKLIGGVSTAAQAALNQHGVSAIMSPARVAGVGARGVAQAAKNVGKAALAEGLTNAAQETISEGASTAGTDKGLTIDPHAVLGSGVLGAAGGAAFSAPKGAKDAGLAVSHRGFDFGPDTERAANRVVQHAGGDAAALDKPTTAFDATSKALSDVHNELDAAASGVRNLSPEASNALQRAKAGDTLSKGDFSALDAYGTPELSSLARQATVLNKLTQKGQYGGGRFAGGAGEFIRNLVVKHPIFAVGASAIPGIASNGMAGLDQMASAIPGMAEAAMGGYAGYKALRGAERVAGIASPARSFADKFSNADAGVRLPAQPSQATTSVPQVSAPAPTPQPWGPAAPDPGRYKPDVLEPGLRKIVEKLQQGKRNETAKAAMPLLRQLAETTKPAEGMDANAVNEQIKGLLLMASARRKVEGQRQAEAEAADSAIINQNGGLDALANPAFGKRAKELLGAADAMRRLRHVPEEDATDAPTAPNDAPQPEPTAPAGGGGAGEAFTLPESPHWYDDPHTASKNILKAAQEGGVNIRHPENYRASTERRLAEEERIYNAISDALPSVAEKGAFHKYGPALWGSDSPEVVQLVKQQMLAEFPQHSAVIEKHLNDGAIKALWTKPKKAKSAK